MRFLARRLAFYIAAFMVAVTLNFFIPRLMPGDPATMLFMSLQGRMKQDQLAALKRSFGFDGSLWDQFVAYLGKLIRLDFGTSTINFPEPTSSLLFYAAGWTLFLVGLATVISFAIGIAMGIFAAWNRGGVFDSIFTPVNVMLNAFTPAIVALPSGPSGWWRPRRFPASSTRNPARRRRSSDSVACASSCSNCSAPRAEQSSGTRRGRSTIGSPTAGSSRSKGRNTPPTTPIPTW